jgi:hypothetical protein
MPPEGGPELAGSGAAETSLAGTRASRFTAPPRGRIARSAPDDWPRFPCGADKNPLTPHGFYDATCDPTILDGWRRRWPNALWGVPTGDPIGAVVLDIDVKRPEANGYDTLDALGIGVLPDTPLAHTRSGGLHVYFVRPPGGLRNTGGARGCGIGPGLDWRGDGGYVILPPSAGYSWDRHKNFETVSLTAVPTILVPRIKLVAETERPSRPVERIPGLSPYAEVALDAAARAIGSAPPGQQEITLNAEAFSIGTLAGAGAIPVDFARKVLIWAARQMRDYDPTRPWRLGEIEFKVNRSFNDGMRHPRRTRHAG